MSSLGQFLKLPAKKAIQGVGAVGLLCSCYSSSNVFKEYASVLASPSAPVSLSNFLRSKIHGHGFSTSASLSSTTSPPKYKTWSIYRRVEAAALTLGFAFVRTVTGGKMHSERCVIETPSVKVIGIPALSDNFMYLVIEKSSLQAVIVDPVEPDNVMNEVRKENVTLSAILTTHHHWDHAGGNEDLVKKYKNEVANAGLEVYGGDERIQGITKKIGQGDKIKLGSLTFDCHFTPCHTTGHICYFLHSEDPTEKPSVFTGDCLFVAGCGRFFEGTPEQMHSALVEKLGKLPSETMVFCGHEYTVNNLKFALSVEPKNPIIQKKLVWAEDQRSKRLPTIPSSIGEEKDTNPFMRCVLREVQSTVKANSPIECMGTLRNMKDNFKAT